MFLIIFSTVFFYSILFTTVIFKCTRKRGDNGPDIVSTRTSNQNNNNNNNSLTSNRNNNTDRETMEKMTDSQKAKFQAELDAALEAKKKGPTKGNAKPISPINDSGGNTLPISLNKPISEGRSKCEINQPIVWSIGHEEATVKKVTQSAPIRKNEDKNEKNLKRKAKSK